MTRHLENKRLGHKAIEAHYRRLRREGYDAITPSNDPTVRRHRDGTATVLLENSNGPLAMYRWDGRRFMPVEDRRLEGQMKQRGQP